MSRFARKPTTRDEIQVEIENLMSALDELKRDVARDSRKRLDGLGSRLGALWQDVHLDEHYADLSNRTRKAGSQAKECASRHPWTTVALAAGACAVIGYLATRR